MGFELTRQIQAEVLEQDFLTPLASGEWREIHTTHHTPHTITGVQDAGPNTPISSDMTKRELYLTLEKYGFGSCRTEIETWLRTEVLLSPNESKYDNLPMGATKQGGEPDLSPGTDWPKYSRRGVPGLRNTSKPITFLAQLRCTDLKPFAPAQFPDFGLLSFFAAIEQNTLVRDENEYPIGCVLFSTDYVETLTRTPFPRALYFGNRLAPCSLKVEASTGIGFEPLSEAIECQFGYSQEMEDRIWNLYSQEIIPTGRHKLFGSPSMLELDIPEEARLLAKTDESPENDTTVDWLLLLEFDLEDTPVDEGGRLYFMIHRDDLAACRFNKTLVLHDAQGRSS